LEPDMRRHLLQICLVAALLALAGASAAHARAVVVATGTPQLVLVDIPSNVVVARLTLGGPTRAVAISPDGSRAYVAAGRRVVVVDPNARTVAGDLDVKSAISALALTSDGARHRVRRRDRRDRGELRERAALASGARANYTNWP